MPASSPAVRRVLMTADTVGGVFTYALDLARGLSDRGVEVVLATMGGELSDEQHAAASRVERLEIRESTYKLEWMNEPWVDVEASGDWLLELEAETRPDVVHLNTYAHGALPFKAKKVMVGHSCVLSWWRAVKGCDAPASWDRYRRAVRAGVAKSDVLVAPSRAMLDSLFLHYGPHADGRVIHNGRALDHQKRGRKTESVLAVGRLWDEAKNVAALDRVAARLPWPVRVAGAEASPDGDAQRFAHVTPLGRLGPSALGAAMAEASIYCLPCRYEPFGLSVLEAAASGCALVVGDVPSLREVWGDAALFVPPDDDEALLRTLRALIDDEQQRAAMAERAQQRARAYSLDGMSRAYLDLYTELAG